MRKSFIILILISGIFFQLYGQSLPVVKPEAVDMNSTRLNLTKDVINDAIKRKDIPGAVLLVTRKGKIVFREAFGNCQLVPQKRPMKVDMIFDMASITKPIATATSIMMLVERGKLRLWDKVKKFVPEFSPFIDSTGQKSSDARIWHLLTHTSGLPPYTDVQEVKKKYGSPCPTDSLIKHIAHLKKTCPPGTEFHYSCLGFITLAGIIKQITGKTVADFAAKNIFQPLGMNSTFFNPPQQYLDRCVPTEVIDNKPLIGIVHDPLARLQGGVSGNAGLFSTADDLAIFAQMMLNNGKYKGVRILSPLTVARMTTVYPEVIFSGRGLGWDLNSAYSTNGGDLFGEKSYGHTGYTGTSIWIDPETETVVIFLTNRVHPYDKGSVVSLRSKVANIVASAIK